jgi:hypothetical protein
MADKKKNYSQKAGGKGLMAAIADYQQEQRAKRKGVDKQGASALGAAAAKGKTETRPSSVTHRKPPTAPPPVRSSSSSSSSSSTPPKKDPPKNVPSQPQLRSQPGGSGTQGRPMPSNPAVGYSNPKPKRSDFPDTRMGTLDYQGALRRWKNKAKGSSPGPSAGRNSGRRGQGGRK